MKLVEIKTRVTVEGLTRCLPGCRHLVTDEQAAELATREEAVVVETAMQPKPEAKTNAAKNKRSNDRADSIGRSKSSSSSSD